MFDMTCVQGFPQKDFENMVIERETEPLFLLETDDRYEEPTNVLRLQHVRPIAVVTLMRSPFRFRGVLARRSWFSTWRCHHRLR